MQNFISRIRKKRPESGDFVSELIVITMIAMIAVIVSSFFVNGFSSKGKDMAEALEGVSPVKDLDSFEDFGDKIHKLVSKDMDKLLVKYPTASDFTIVERGDSYTLKYEDFKADIIDKSVVGFNMDVEGDWKAWTLTVETDKFIYVADDSGKVLQLEELDNNADDNAAKQEEEKSAKEETPEPEKDLEEDSLTLEDLTILNGDLSG